MEMIRKYWSQLMVFCAVIAFAFKFFYDVKALQKENLIQAIENQKVESRLDNVLDLINTDKNDLQLHLKDYYYLKTKVDKLEK